MAKAATKTSSPLDGALRALERGDVLAARRAAKDLLAQSPVSAAGAQDLLARTAFPKRAFLLAGVGLALWVGMVLLAVFRG
jgi:hypothetical protein